jgi:predicted Zn finger-like uncharacterized protein
MTTMMAVQCPHCRATFRVPADASGKIVACGSCHERVLVPQQLDHENYTGWVRLPPHRVLFPSVAQAIVRVLTDDNLAS